MFTFNATVMNGTQSALTEIYMNQPVWYPDGYKWVWSDPKNGKPREGVFVEETQNGHYLQFSLFDPLMYTDENITILITRKMNETMAKGKVESTDKTYVLDYQYTDTGYTGKCNIKV